MNRWFAWIVLTSACASPCETLADRVCAKRPAPDALCTRLRAIAEAPSVAERQACAAGNTVADELTKR